MDTELARMNSEILTNTFHNLEDCRKLLISKCEAMTALWQSGSADEFQDLHTTQMNILWSNIQKLITLSIDLDAAITIAEQADHSLAGW
jgi:hypothetical protein